MIGTAPVEPGVLAASAWLQEPAAPDASLKWCESEIQFLRRSTRWRAHAAGEFIGGNIQVEQPTATNRRPDFVTSFEDGTVVVEATRALHPSFRGSLPRAFSALGRRSVTPSGQITTMPSGNPRVLSALRPVDLSLEHD